MPRTLSYRPLHFAAMAVVCAALAAGAPVAPLSGAVFPNLHTEALDKTPVTLPAQLQGAYNLLLLSWTRDQADQVSTWAATGDALKHMYPDVRVYRMPVSNPENALFRWWDNSSMRTDETDPDSLHWTLPLYTDESQLRASLGVSAHDTNVLALLVNRAGKVVWKAEGPSSAATRQSLLHQAALLHHGSR